MIFLQFRYFYSLYIVAGIVVITDGIVGLPEATVFESLMASLRHQNIACSFIHVGCTVNRGTGLGQVSYSELLQFMATATFGAYFSKIPDLVSVSTSQKSRESRKLMLVWKNWGI